MTGASAGIIADVSELFYVDSAGIEAIFKLLDKAQDKSLLTVFVTDENAYINKKFKELGMFSFSQVKISKSIEEAQRSLAA